MDEGTDVSGTAQIRIFVRGIDDNFYVCEELLKNIQPQRNKKINKSSFKYLAKALVLYGLSWDKLSNISKEKI